MFLFAPAITLLLPCHSTCRQQLWTGRFTSLICFKWLQFHRLLPLSLLSSVYTSLALCDLISEQILHPTGWLGNLSQRARGSIMPIKSYYVYQNVSCATY
ncbi:hypothetical protein K505DRAFT_142740 [Melanomma pulvis-pyrius CBS 109.77]|uniref:Uncharacterized protein n=1 Tax=Melanomma pulvis-pyrius CBS 109.77 TaxID=1314802 RepID=A0A6A6XPG3_9PLEO|nr:hypothetical protein K505DRAFT_142740 [Melanomma pulvis-pyrius CBS 109.77]